MIKKIKIDIKKNLVLFENFSFLSILQASNLIIFLLTIPYLLRILGKENYGVIVFAQTIAIYFTVIVNFGFNVSAIRDVSMYKNDHNKMSSIISSVLILKFAFFCFSIIALSVLVFLNSILREHQNIFYTSMLFCLSEALSPVWYFQGIEKMKFITFINVGTRSFSAILFFFLIKKPTDYYLVPILLGSGTVIGAIIGLYIVFIKHKNNFKFLSFKELVDCTRLNIPLFISNLSSQIYVNANKLIVGSCLGMQEIAIYDIADRIINILKVPISLIGQTLFPRVSRDRNVKFIKKTMWITFSFFTAVYICVISFKYLIVRLFSGSSNIEAAQLLSFLSLSILPISLGLFFNELILVPFGFLRDYAKMRFYSVALYITIVGVTFFLKQIGLFQLAGIIIFVEFFVFAYSLYLCKKNNIFDTCSNSPNINTKSILH